MENPNPTTADDTYDEDGNDAFTEEKPAPHGFNEVQLEEDAERRNDQVLEYAKARFRAMLKNTIEMRAEERRKKRRKKQPTNAAATVTAFGDVAGLSIEEQLRMQIACLTQSHLECATRAAAEQPPEEDDDDDDTRFRRRQPPSDPKQSHRMLELRNQTYLALATARLVETFQRSEGVEVRHAFTYEHLHRHAAASPQKEKEETAEEMKARMDSVADQVFDGIEIIRRPVEDPPPPPLCGVRFER